ncbi:TPA: hypothetical protein HA281_04560 [Candidatus Woesearchaeota archaeon]|nr:hypothetical protein [Candidatus Woesearchaeota archaeon]HIH92051.1 hypothetical protein [Candidatus Woesearchaeota archaeon]HIJ18374.1 hypothetical protein [Candidatus Woesearchaeota archaeon]
MKNKKAQFSAENVMMGAGVIVTLFGALILILGFTNNNPNTVSNGAIIFLIGVAILAVARKIF